jgi:glycosyltransferase involved in cell wall biosynthesis
VLVEAMLSRRVAIVTDVAGSPEVLEDNRTGFLAQAPTDLAVDEALERAWSRRSEWAEIGQAAHTAIKTLTPTDPAAFFTEQLLRLTSEPPDPIDDPWGRRP